MAINPKNHWSPQHASITCATGNGKGIGVTSLGWYNPKAPLIIFDPYGEYDTKFGKHKCHNYRTRRGFALAFARAFKQNKPFVLSYTPQDDKDPAIECEWFANLAWTASDGNRLLYVLFEEYGTLVTSTGKESGKVGEIVTGGRKFGLRAGFIFQRSAEVPKTIWGNTKIKIIGAQEFTTDCKRIKDQVGCSIEDVQELGSLNNLFAVDAPELMDTVKTKVHYLVSSGLGQFKRQAAIVEPCRKYVKKWSKEQKIAHKNSRFELINP